MSPRSNSIQISKIPAVPTPAPLLPTQRGQLPHIPPDLLPLALPPNHPPLLLQIALLDWHTLSRSNPPIKGASLFSKLREKAEKNGHKEFEQVYNNGLKGYCRLENAILFLSSRRAGSGEFVTDTPGKTTSIQWDGCGRVSPAEVGLLHRALKTDFVCSPGDHAVLPGRRTALIRRVKRAEKQVDELVESLGGGGEVLASVQGGDDADVRAMAGKGARDGMKGYCLDGFYCGEGVEERWKGVEEAVKGLPEGLRILGGGWGGPGEVVRAVEYGVDVIEGGWVFEMAVEGYATDLGGMGKVNCRERGVEGLGAGLVEGCTCWVCSRFSRGYVRHLFEVHEMMGVTLVAMHNLWDYLMWFQRVRKAVAGGRWEEFREEFEQKRMRLRITEGGSVVKAGAAQEAVEPIKRSC